MALIVNLGENMSVNMIISVSMSLCVSSISRNL